MYYEIQSGKPAGELYHRDVQWAKTPELAEQCRQSMETYIEASGQIGNWLWGPHVYEREGDPAECLVWNGFEEVPAEEYVG